MQKYTYKSQFATDFEYIASKNNQLTVLYLHGFCSNAWGRKPEEVKNVCLQKGLGFVRFDFAGHGSDSENFEKTDFSIWQNQIWEIVENVIVGKFAVVGSSMGGWLALLTALRYPERVKAVIGLAAAPNFVKYFASQISLEQQCKLEQNGKFRLTNNNFSYLITSRFVTTALEACLPDEKNDVWPIECDVCLLQGMKDASVPWQKALEYAQRISSEKVKVCLLKNSNHRLNDDEAINELRHCIANIVNI